MLQEVGVGPGLLMQLFDNKHIILENQLTFKKNNINHTIIRDLTNRKKNNIDNYSGQLVDLLAKKFMVRAHDRGRVSGASLRQNQKRTLLLPDLSMPISIWKFYAGAPDLPDGASIWDPQHCIGPAWDCKCPRGRGDSLYDWQCRKSPHGNPFWSTFLCASEHFWDSGGLFGQPNCVEAAGWPANWVFVRSDELPGSNQPWPGIDGNDRSRKEK